MKRCGLSVVTMEVYLNKKLPVFDDVWPGKKTINKFSIVGDMFCKEVSWDIDDRWLDEYNNTIVYNGISYE